MSTKKAVKPGKKVVATKKPVTKPAKVAKKVVAKPKTAPSRAKPAAKKPTSSAQKAAKAKPVKASAASAKKKPAVVKPPVKKVPVKTVKKATSKPSKPAAKAASTPKAKSPPKASPAKSPTTAASKSASNAKPAVGKPASAKPSVAGKPVPAAVPAGSGPALAPVGTPTSPSGRGRAGKSKAVVTSNPDIEMPSYQFTPVAAPPVIATPAKRKIDPKLAGAWKSKAGDQLTDAEVLAMPDSEYMNEKQLAFFRHKLVTLKNDLLSNADETTEHLREDTVIVPDPADRATIEEEHALELRTRDRERKLLKKIEQSIVRIDAGDYGFCDETGEEIGVARLIARPTATLSLEAQQRREMKQKMFGD